MSLVTPFLVASVAHDGSPHAVAMARGGTFGLTSSRRGRGGFRGSNRGNTSFRGGRGRGRGANNAGSGPKRDNDGTKLAERFERITLDDEVGEKLGFSRIQEGPKKEAWLVNMHPVSIRCPLPDASLTQT